MDKPNIKKPKRCNSRFSRKVNVQRESVHVIKPLKSTYDKSKKVVDDWNLYLPDESYDLFTHFSSKLKAIEGFLHKMNYPLNSLSKTKWFQIDVNNILEDKVFLSYWPDFLNELTSSPKLVIGLFGFSMEQFIKNNASKDDDDDDYIADSAPDPETVPIKLNPRFIGLQNYSSFQDLKLHNYDKFVTLMGTVVRVSDVKPICTCIAFRCVKCQSVQVVLQNNNCYTTPNTCSGDGCFSRVFKPLLNSSMTRTIPKKNIRLQEMNIDHNEGGRVPRSIECELTCDLTDSCLPGDSVIISGILTTNQNDERKIIGKDACSYILNIFANSVTCLKGKHVDHMGISSGYSELLPDDLGAIQKIHAESNLFRLLVASLCPSIYGHELIKAGLILGLFGGRDRSHKENNKTDFTIRENSHILIVGDPGLGKSQMLLACSNVSPRGVYVCGNSTTSSGLTVTISKEGGGENSLEAGALVLADQGHCCIDEFDKLVNQHSALLEAMEQQTISMAKSGVVCTLPARTSILAAANPSGGHYNKSKTVSENLKIGGSLLSRFDLVFIVQDEPDQEIDCKMSKHVMGLHTNSQIKYGSSSDCFTSSYFLKADQEVDSLSQRLKVEPHEKINFIPPLMMQKYISYARKFAQPKLTPEVSEILKKFYLNMRKQHKLTYTTPITTRQLESLIRLTEARARTELRAFCTKNDAEEVIEIMKYSMRETYSDEFGNLDFDRSIHGSGMSKTSQAKKLINLITSVATQRCDDRFSVSEIQQLCKKLNISADSVHTLIATLNDQGFLLKTGYQSYKVQTL